jgi:hypothetical protein
MIAPLTTEEKRFCEYWLQFPSRMWTNLGRDQFNLSTVKKLIMYELESRRRKRILDRLIGRYYRLLRDRAWSEVKKGLEADGERVDYRAVFSEESEKYWRQSI